MLCFQSVLYCIVLYNDVFTFLYVAVGNKLLLSGWARVSQCILTAITRVDCCRLDDVSFIWLP